MNIIILIKKLEEYIKTFDENLIIKVNFYGINLRYDNIKEYEHYNLVHIDRLGHISHIHPKDIAYDKREHLSKCIDVFVTKYQELKESK